MLTILLLGLITGFLFGFFLQKANVVRYEIIMNQLLLKDFTVVKVMFSAIVTGSIGVYLLNYLGYINFDTVSLSFGRQVLGGFIFGIGFALLGYCPGTGMGAAGEGRWDALVGILGGVFGGAVFAELYPRLKATVYTWGAYGDVKIPALLRLDAWVIIALLTAGVLLLFRWLEKEDL